MVFKLGNKNSETALIADCRKKDRKSQRALFEIFSPKMLSVCKRYILEPNIAETQMLDGFMTVFEKIDTFQEQGSFEGWIRKIMVNTCLMWIRKNRLMYKEVDIDDVHHELNFDDLSSSLEAEDLLKIINELPQGYKTIFNMYAIEGYAHAEIAEELNISVNTSKSQLSRSRAYLQKKLAEIDQSSGTKKRGNGS